MNFPFKLRIKGKSSETLDKNSYKGAGGEGTILQKGGTAYKVYHDPARTISVRKIEELTALKSLPNVLGPEDIILDYKKDLPIGFTMRFVTDTEYLCRLFNRNFRDSEKVTPEMIVELVKNLQKTLVEIHKAGILVVDYNEMNFLVNRKTFVDPFHIDVDSYQTPNFKASAIMESIRDRSTPKGQFSQLSDWFSFGVVAFQLYMGVHPYKGKHPNYKPKQWSDRMDDNISVFNKEVTLPPSCQDWSVIPKPHLDWFKRVFEDQERSIPPMPDQSQVVAMIHPTLIPSTDSFEVKLLKQYDDTITSVAIYNGTPQVVTKKALYSGSRPVYRFMTKPQRIGIAELRTKDPILVTQEGKEIVFTSTEGTEVSRVYAHDAMEYQGRIYTYYGGAINEHSFMLFGTKIVPKVKRVCNIFEPTTKFFKGVAVQDILGTCWLAIPYEEGICINTRAPELDKIRIIDAKYESGVCILIGERKNTYSRYVLCFDDKHQKYTIRETEDIDFGAVCFTTLPNRVTVNVVENEKVEVFRDNSKIKVVENAPFDSSVKLFNDGSTVMFAIGDKLHSVRLKLI